jgi:hypothetical protein
MRLNSECLPVFWLSTCPCLWMLPLLHLGPGICVTNCLALYSFRFNVGRAWPGILRVLGAVTAALGVHHPIRHLREISLVNHILLFVHDSSLFLGDIVVFWLIERATSIETHGGQEGVQQPQLATFFTFGSNFLHRSRITHWPCLWTPSTIGSRATTLRTSSSWVRHLATSQRSVRCGIAMHCSSSP